MLRYLRPLVIKCATWGYIGGNCDRPHQLPPIPRMRCKSEIKTRSSQSFSGWEDVGIRETPSDGEPVTCSTKYAYVPASHLGELHLLTPPTLREFRHGPFRSTPPKVRELTENARDPSDRRGTRNITQSLFDTNSPGHMKMRNLSVATGDFPIRYKEWGLGAVRPFSPIYLDAAKTECALCNLSRVLGVGSELALSVWPSYMAPRQVQERKMMGLNFIRANIEEHSHLFRPLAFEMQGDIRIGVGPPFR